MGRSLDNGSPDTAKSRATSSICISSYHHRSSEAGELSKPGTLQAQSGSSRPVKLPRGSSFEKWSYQTLTLTTLGISTTIPRHRHFRVFVLVTTPAAFELSLFHSSYALLWLDQATLSVRERRGVDLGCLGRREGLSDRPKGTKLSGSFTNLSWIYPPFTTPDLATNLGMDPSTNGSALPIALRRTKRRASDISPIKSTSQNETAPTTPTIRRASKRVRFSAGDFPSVTSTHVANTTGLTPAVGRATLQTPKSKRPATPARTAAEDLSSSPVPDTEYVQFTPLRQALDERCKRRIRRNHLSEEINDYEADKRTNAQLRKELKEKNTELQRLQAGLDAAKTSTKAQRASVSEIAAAQSRVAEVEEELDTLRRSFGLSETLPQTNETWDHIHRTGNGPNSEGGDTILIYEDDADPYVEQNEDAQPNPQDQADAALMGLELESARKAKQSMLSSFSRTNRSFTNDLDFADSPSKPQDTTTSAAPPTTPPTLHHNLSKQLKATISRAEDAELALTALEGEVRALGFTSTPSTSVSASLTALADHFRSIRLELERLMPGETTISLSNNAELCPELMRRITSLISKLHSREAELKSLRNQERSLKGNFDHALLAAHKADAKIKDLEKALDQMAEESMETRMRAQEFQRQCDESTKDNEKLQAALEKYRGEVKRLEDLIEKTEGEHQIAMQQVKEESSSAWERVDEMEAKVSAEETGRRKAEESAVSRLKRIQDLEAALQEAREWAEKVQERLTTAEDQQTLRTEEKGALNARISGLATALASANAEVEKLRQTNMRLEQQYRTEVAQGEQTVSRMHEELIKAATRITEAGKGYKRGSKVRLANWELGSDDVDVDERGMPMTPVSVVRFAEESEEFGGESDSLPGSVQIQRGKHTRAEFKKLLTPEMSARAKKGRRRYDSGIGMSPLTESAAEGDSGIGSTTPELSSEADVEMEDGKGVGVY